MKQIDENNMDAAIALGDAVCEELGICCNIRGRIIFQIYKKLEEVKLIKEKITLTQQSPEAKTE